MACKGYTCQFCQVVIDRLLSKIAITNTSLSRPEILRDLNKKKEGGLSGNPIKDLSDRVLKFLYRETKQELILIGVGGVPITSDVSEFGSKYMVESYARMYRPPRFGDKSLDGSLHRWCSTNS